MQEYDTTLDDGYEPVFTARQWLNDDDTNLRTAAVQSESNYAYAYEDAA